MKRNIQVSVREGRSRRGTLRLQYEKERRKVTKRNTEVTKRNTEVTKGTPRSRRGTLRLQYEKEQERGYERL